MYDSPFSWTMQPSWGNRQRVAVIKFPLSVEIIHDHWLHGTTDEVKCCSWFSNKNKTKLHPVSHIYRVSKKCCHFVSYRARPMNCTQCHVTDISQFCNINFACATTSLILCLVLSNKKAKIK